MVCQLVNDMRRAAGHKGDIATRENDVQSYQHSRFKIMGIWPIKF